MNFLYFQVVKHAIHHGATSAARKYSTVLGYKMNESSVRNWVKKYHATVAGTEKDINTVKPADLANKPKGRSFLIGLENDQKVQQLVKGIREAGGVINRNIVLSLGFGVLSASDRSVLKKYGGPIDLTRTWAESIMQRMGYVRRKGTKAARKLPQNFDEQKADFLQCITNTVKKHKIPDELIINFDQTGMKIVPVSNWTLDLKGGKQVPIIGKDDKREVTALLAVNILGETLPPQIIYQGTTNRCHPNFKFPSDWDITHTENHWSETGSMCRYVDKVIKPYVEKVRDELDLPLKQRALVVCDVFKAHQTPEFKQKLRDAGCDNVNVPGGCTGDLQPLDITGNKIFKDELKGEFTDWYANLITAGLKKNLEIKDIKVDLTLSNLKPIHAGWVLHSFDKMKQDKHALVAGWEKAGIKAAVAAARK